MRISRVYIDQTLHEGKDVTVSAEAAHYLTKVLRLKPEHLLHVFNEHCGEYQAYIASISKQQTILSIESAVRPPDSNVVSMHLGLGLSRGERMDYAIQKATELGVTTITPLFTEHSEVKLDKSRAEKKLMHWQKIAVNAAEQCGRISVPALRPVMLLREWLVGETADLQLMFHAEGISLGSVVQSRKAQLVKDFSGNIKSVNLAVGPEGGFSTKEMEVADGAGYAIASLGPRILRTETAPVVALSLLQYLIGDLAG